MSGSDNCCDEQEENVNVGVRGVSYKLVWQNVGSLPTSRETFCDVHGHRFDTAELDAVNAFVNSCDIVQVITDETNIHTLQEILKGVNPFTFHSRTDSRKMLQWTKWIWLLLSLY